MFWRFASILIWLNMFSVFSENQDSLIRLIRPELYKAMIEKLDKCKATEAQRNELIKIVAIYGRDYGTAKAQSILSPSQLELAGLIPRKNGSVNAHSSTKDSVVNLTVVADRSKAAFKHFWRGWGGGNDYWEIFIPQIQKLLHSVDSEGLFEYSRVALFYDQVPSWSKKEIWPNPQGKHVAIYNEDSLGNPKYDFERLDQYFDELVLRHNYKLIVSVCPVPRLLSSHPETVNAFLGGKGNNSPPKDFIKWKNLVFATVQHLQGRYGVGRTRQWYWEIWNEPDLWQQFWKKSEYEQASLEDFLRTYDFAVAGICSADDSLKIGGSGFCYGAKENTKESELSREVIRHCAEGINFANGRKGSRLDFLSFHSYGPASLFECKEKSFLDELRRYPQLCKVGIQCNEFNTSLDGRTNETEYAACNIAKVIDYCIEERRRGIPFDLIGLCGLASNNPGFELSGNLWSFGMVSYCEPQRFVFKRPAYHLYSFLSKMGTQQCALTGSSYGDEIHGFAARDTFGDVSVLLYRFDEDDLASDIPGLKNVKLTISSVSSGFKDAQIFRIDNENANFLATWRRLGKPSLARLTLNQAKQIQSGCEPNPTNLTMQQIKGNSVAEFTMRTQSIVFIRFSKVKQGNHGR